VEISDTDLGGVVYYGRYAHILDRAVIAYRRHIGIAPLGPEGHLFVVRRVEMDYLASARFEDELDIAVWIPQIGRSSHTVACQITHVETQSVLLRADYTIVGVSGYTGGRPTRMPPEMVHAIVAHEGDSVQRP
jgi:acyl-CoA thioester hydrolase